MNRPSIAKSLSSERLQSDHKRLELLFDSLSVLASLGDWRVCNAIWVAFSDEVEAHMRLEEEELLPTFASSSPAATHQACQILMEHERIRDELDRVGMELQLCSFRASGVKELVEQLRANAQRESTTLYPFWKQQESSVVPESWPTARFSTQTETCSFV